jgi:hypothetical protein
MTIARRLEALETHVTMQSFKDYEYQVTLCFENDGHKEKLVHQVTGHEVTDPVAIQSFKAWEEAESKRTGVPIELRVHFGQPEAPHDKGQTATME